MKKLAHVEMIIDAKYVFDCMEWAQGKAVGEPKFRPVKHGGTDEENPETVVARPTAREFLLTFARVHKRWKVSDAIEESDKYGFTRGSVYGAHTVFIKEKVIKRVGDGEYALMAKGMKLTAPKGEPVIAEVKKKMRARPSKPHPLTGRRMKPEGTTMNDKVLAALKALQNGTGEGVPLASIRAKMHYTKNINPYLRDLIVKKVVTRVAPGTYRAIAN